jgi:hypothetical protein
MLFRETCFQLARFSFSCVFAVGVFCFFAGCGACGVGGVSAETKRSYESAAFVVHCLLWVLTVVNFGLFCAGTAACFWLVFYGSVFWCWLV